MRRFNKLTALSLVASLTAAGLLEGCGGQESANQAPKPAIRELCIAVMGQLGRALGETLTMTPEDKPVAEAFTGVEARSNKPINVFQVSCPMEFADPALREQKVVSARIDMTPEAMGYGGTPMSGITYVLREVGDETSGGSIVGGSRDRTPPGAMPAPVTSIGDVDLEPAPILHEICGGNGYELLFFVPDDELNQPTARTNFTCYDKLGVEAKGAFDG